MAEQRIIELTDFYLELDGNKFPLLSLELTYSVGGTPSVEAVVSGANNISGGSPALELIDDSDGTIASIKLGIKAHAGGRNAVRSVMTIFCGYIISCSPTFVCNAVSIASVRTIRLVAAVEVLNTIPLGMMSFYGADGFSQDTAGSPLPYQFINSANLFFTEYQIESKYFNIDTGSFLTRFLSAERRVIEQAVYNAQSKRGSVPMTLAASVEAVKAVPTIQLQETCRLSDTLHTYIADLFAVQSPTSVLSTIAHNFFLEWIPVTLGPTENNEPCKMILFPINNWDTNYYFELSPGDLLDVRGVANFRVGSTVDCWVVSYNNSGKESIYSGPAAVYGPGWITKSGEATIIESMADLKRAVQQGQGEYNKRRGAVGDESTFFLSARNVTLPAWLSANAAMEFDTMEATGQGSTEAITVSKNGEKALKTVEDWAKIVAKQAFLVEGMSQRSARARIPLWRWLTLLPYLGRVGKLNVLTTAGGGSALDASKLPTKTYYGLLSELTLSIKLDNNNISCQCGMQMAAVRDEALQAELSAEDGFYKWDPGQLDDYLSDAVEISDQLLAMEGKKWGEGSRGVDMTDYEDEANEELDSLSVEESPHGDYINEEP